MLAQSASTFGLEQPALLTPACEGKQYIDRKRRGGLSLSRLCAQKELSDKPKFRKAVNEVVWVGGFVAHDTF